jgi:hypothetical protein
MKLRVPMPSPRGTNRAGLFLTGAPARALAAYDAALSPGRMAYGGRRARDADLIPTGGYRAGERRDRDGDFGVGKDQEEGDDLIAQVKRFLANRLSREDFQRLEEMLAGGGEEGGDPDDEGGHLEDPMPKRPPPNGTQDDPTPFRGAPRPGGQAQDARGDDYFSQFGNQHVGTFDYGSGVR